MGAGLALADPVGPAGLVLVVGFYALGVAATRPNPMIERYGFDPNDVEEALQHEISDMRGRVAPEILVRIQRIEFITRTQLLPRLDCLAPGSLELYLVERTAREYLPRAVNNYLLLSGGSLSAPGLAHGVTPLQVVIDELDLLERQMRHVAEVIQRADMDRLLAHRRFLNDRFSGVDISG